MKYHCLLFICLISPGLVSAQVKPTRGNKPGKVNNQLVNEVDICVYGGTSAGVMAAYSAKKLGKSVILIEPGTHLGGLTSGGLGATDIGNKYAITGLARNFYRRMGQHYGNFENWTFEPHLAEQLFEGYLKEADVPPVLYQYRIVSAQKQGARIQTITLESAMEPAAPTNRVIKAKMFIDASYEGDLMARAGVSYTVGREANSLYGETYNGVQMLDKHQFPDGVDPYVVPGDPKSGLLWGISSETLSPNGTGDKKVQAYNYRLCLTQTTGNQLPFVKPDDYDAAHYELLFRLWKVKPWKSIHEGMHPVEMPQGKTDVNNNGPFSTDYIGNNYAYPEASYADREKMARNHANYIKGYLYFLSHDERVPEPIRQEMNSWGYAKDEFTDNSGFPHQLYVREARRMVGEYVMTQKNCQGAEKVADVVGMAAYTMDSHNIQRVVVNGNVKNEGDVQIGGFPPYPISYRSLTPKREECQNLLVPVCLSASHIAYGSIRMEPVFMVLAQSSAVAAALAIDGNKAMQTVDVQQIQGKLKKDPLLDGSTPEVMVDNADAARLETEGNWQVEKTNGNNGANAQNFLLSKEKNGKPRSVTIRPGLAKGGKYKVYYYCPGLTAYANEGEIPQSVPCRINAKNGIQQASVDFRANARSWAYLGEYEFAGGSSDSFQIAGEEINGPIGVDAVLFIPGFK